MLAVEEGVDGDFVGGVEDGGQGAAGLAGPAGEVEGGEIVAARGASKSSFASLAKSSGSRLFGTRSGQVSAYWIGKHMSVWLSWASTEPIDELDHRVDDALRMDDHVDAVHVDAEEPAGLDHFQALVEERGGVDGDLAAHVPGRMFERLLRR